MIEWTGERYVPWADDPVIGYEHLHRYRFAKEFVKDKKVLDLACGEGYGSFMLCEEADSVIGIDIDEVSIRHASSKYIKGNLKFIKGSVTDIPIKEEKIFDVIVCFEALEHIEEHDELLKEVKRLLKDEGVFIVSTPNKYIYSDQPNYQNPFHLKELYFDEFKDLLLKKFENILLYGQKVYPSSNIFPLHKESGPSNNFVIEKGDKEFHFLPSEKKSARYFIAVASDSRFERAELIGDSHLIDISETLFRQRDAHISNLEGVAREKEAEAEGLRAGLVDKERELGSLKETISQRDAHISGLEVMVRDKDAHISNLEGVARKKEAEAEGLRAGLVDKERELGSLNETVSQKDSKISELSGALSERDGVIAGLNESFRQRDIHISHLEGLVREREAALAASQSILQERDQNISHLEAVLRKKETEIGNLNETINQRDTHTSHLEAVIRDREGEITALNVSLSEKEGTLNHIYNSHGWKFLLKYYAIRDKVLPAESRRRNFIKFIWNLRTNIKKSISYTRLYGFKVFVRKVKEKLQLEVEPINGREIVRIPQITLVKIEDEEIITVDGATVSVVIPTKNAGTDFEYLLSMLKNQKGIKEIEIVVVDSGSTDETLKIAGEYGAKIIEIPPQSFTHSYARNLGADNAEGDYLFFTVQDALPPSYTFLYELFIAMKNNDVVAVSCAESPREDADLFYRVISWNHYRFLEVDKNDKILSMPEKEDYITLRKNGQLSDIACLIPSDVFMKYKYRFNYAEDLDLGMRIIRNGHNIAFLSSTKIIHSHNRPTYYFLKRGYVDNLFLADIFPDFTVPSIRLDDLARGIVFIYSAINSLFKGELFDIKTPCDIDGFINIVTGKFKSALNSKYPASVDITGNQYIDDDFRAFLKEIYTGYLFREGNVSYDGILINAMLGFIGMTFEYIRESFESIDDYLLEDFKACIFKEYALICGAHLAYCYLKSSDSERERLRRINYDLSKGI